MFVDRDGVLNEPVFDQTSGAYESPLAPDDVALVPGAADAVRRLQAVGWLVVGVSNQPAAAKGRLTVDALVTVQARVVTLLARDGAVLDGFELCLHHPDGVVAGLAGPCDCRKPAPGLLLRAADSLAVDLSQSWMAGDTDADIGAGRAAGCATALIMHPRTAHKRSVASAGAVQYPSLAAFAAGVGSPESR